MIRYALAFVSALLVTLVIMPLTLKLTKRLKCRQTVLHYVENHSGKSGTPTMGGIAFVFAIAVVSLIFSTGDRALMFMNVAVTVAYGIVGFLDDFIKVYYKQNKGLSAIQKIIFQTAIAVIVSTFAYFNPIIGDKLLVPITFSAVNIGWFAIPFYSVFFLAVSNAVNLVDGLDGLASEVTVTYLISFIMIILSAMSVGVFSMAETEISNVVVFVLAIIGSLVGFLCYNSYPAKIFMGDTGSMALGGAVAGVAIVTRTALITPIIGIIYVVTCLSVIIQVLYFKKTKKRVFLMTPLHHHFEKKGEHENHIVKWYAVVTLIFGVMTAIFTLVFN